MPISTQSQETLERLVLAARIGAEFIDHWVGEHAMDWYPSAGTLRDLHLVSPGSARDTAEFIREALKEYKDVLPESQPVEQDTEEY